MQTDVKKPVALIILDGWGIRKEKAFNAIAAAHPTTFNRLWKEYPHTTLSASGHAVGLPEGTAGNSEVGHLTLGAGRIIPQTLTLINELIAHKKFCTNSTLSDAYTRLARDGGALHLIGLVSDGNVHSNQEHLHKLIACAVSAGIERIFIHAILDGRDTPPQSAARYLTALENYCIRKKAGVIGSLCGRLYAMDRDEQWERTYAAYQLYTQAPEIHEHHWSTVLEHFYKDGITDEFIPPINIHPEAFIRPEDGVILFNFRPDRMRQLTSLLTGTSLPLKRDAPAPAASAPLACRFVLSMIRYHRTFKNPIIFEKELVTDTLLDRLEQKGLTLYTIAETEKYAHVTYFFSGGREIARKNETRTLIPSLGLKNYAASPCMSAAAITDAIVTSLRNDPRDFYLVNYANADMVGHSGDFEATVAAVQCVDEQLATLFDEIVTKRDGTIFIVADHGNAEEKWDFITESPRTAHTTNPVPFIAVNAKSILPPMYGLSDVAAVIEKAW